MAATTRSRVLRQGASDASTSEHASSSRDGREAQDDSTTSTAAKPRATRASSSDTPTQQDDVADSTAHSASTMATQQQAAQAAADTQDEPTERRPAESEEEGEEEVNVTASSDNVIQDELPGQRKPGHCPPKVHFTKEVLNSMLAELGSGRALWSDEDTDNLIFMATGFDSSLNGTENINALKEAIQAEYEVLKEQDEVVPGQPFVLTNARELALEFYYCRWQFHSGILDLPRLSPEEADRLLTARVIDHSLMDFPLGAALVAKGALIRHLKKELLAEKDGPIPAGMYWTTSTRVHRPAVEEIADYIREQESKRGDDANEDELAYTLPAWARPKLTVKWARKHTKKNGVYGLKAFGFTDADVAPMLMEKDALYRPFAGVKVGPQPKSVSNKAPRVNSPDFLKQAPQKENSENAPAPVRQSEETNENTGAVDDAPSVTSEPTTIAPKSPDAGIDDAKAVEGASETPSTACDPATTAESIEPTIETKEPILETIEPPAPSFEEVITAPRRSQRVRANKETSNTENAVAPTDAQSKVAKGTKRKAAQTKPKKSLKRKALHDDEFDENTTENVVEKSYPEEEKEKEDATGKATKAGNGRTGRNLRSKAKETASQPIPKESNAKASSGKAPAKAKGGKKEVDDTNVEGLRRSKRRRNA